MVPSKMRALHSLPQRRDLRLPLRQQFGRGRPSVLRNHVPVEEVGWPWPAAVCVSPPGVTVALEVRVVCLLSHLHQRGVDPPGEVGFIIVSYTAIIQYVVVDRPRLTPLPRDALTRTRAGRLRGPARARHRFLRRTTASSWARISSSLRGSSAVVSK